MFLPLRSLLFAATISGVSMALNGEANFECGVPEFATEIPNAAAFNTIRTNYYSLKWNDFKSLLMPKTMHWHVYAIADGKAPRYSVFPEGLVKVVLSGNKLEFKQDNDFWEDSGYSKGDSIEVSINVFVPISNLRFIEVDGTDDSVEVIATDESLFENMTSTHTINIHNSGVNTHLYVSAPFSKVNYRGSGVDNKFSIQAANDSSVDLSGVNQDGRIKSDYLSRVDMSGVDQSLLIEGDYEEVRMSGVDGVLLVNGPNGCNDVHTSGVDTKCRTTTADSVSVSELPCLSSTKVIRAMGLSKGSWIGSLISTIVAIVVCVFCCHRCRRRKQDASRTTPTTDDTPPPTSFENPPKDIEATEVGLEDHADPEHPVAKGY